MHTFKHQTQHPIRPNWDVVELEIHVRDRRSTISEEFFQPLVESVLQSIKVKKHSTSQCTAILNVSPVSTHFHIH